MTMKSITGSHSDFGKKKKKLMKEKRKNSRERKQINDNFVIYINVEMTTHRGEKEKAKKRGKKT